MTAAELVAFIMAQLRDEHGVGADLDSVGDWDITEPFVEIHGNLDVQHLAVEILHSMIAPNVDIAQLTGNLLAALDGRVMLYSGKILGVAEEPWLALRNRLGLFGYPTADEYRHAIVKAGQA